MKVTVKIDNRSYNVEIGDLYSRPIVAMVDGERFEVWPQDETKSQVRRQAASESEARAPGLASQKPQATKPNSNTITAPIPGTIISLDVQSGDRVEVGDPICVLEAMKMKNTIRAGRTGKIASVKVAVGQKVQHGDVLATFVP